MEDGRGKYCHRDWQHGAAWGSMGTSSSNRYALELYSALLDTCAVKLMSFWVETGFFGTCQHGAQGHRGTSPEGEGKECTSLPAYFFPLISQLFHLACVFAHPCQGYGWTPCQG